MNTNDKFRAYACVGFKINMWSTDTIEVALVTPSTDIGGVSFCLTSDQRASFIKGLNGQKHVVLSDGIIEVWRTGEDGRMCFQIENSGWRTVVYVMEPLASLLFNEVCSFDRELVKT